MWKNSKIISQEIWNDLDQFNKNDDSIDDFKQIWINSWEHSLLCSPEECLMKIINEIDDATIEDGGSGSFYIYLKKKI